MSVSNEEKRVLSLTTEAAIRLGLLAVMIVACSQIVLPFALPVIWGVILAIALWPIVQRLTKILGGRRRLAVALLTLFLMASLIIPCWLMAESVVDAIESVGTELADRTEVVPAPPEGIADWPVVGGKLEAAWTKAHDDPPAAIHALTPYIKTVGHFLVDSVTGLAGGVLFFLFSIVLAGVFMATATGGAHAVDALAGRLTGDERGRALVKTAVSTVSSVVKGVLGVAAIQAALATIGMLVVGVPGAAAWGLLVLLVAVVQLPPALVILPVSAYVFTTTGTVGAVAFLIWSILVILSESVLKPMLLGRGADVPVLVILIGALGGLFAWGMLGLFVGSVVLAVGWQLARAWLEDPYFAPTPTEAES